MVKKLLTVGFFDTKITKTNLWATSELPLDFGTSSPNTRFQALSNFTNNFGLGLTPDLALRDSPNSTTFFFKTVSFYQQSFSWFLFRASFFNGLVPTTLTSGLTLSNPRLSSQNSLGSHLSFSTALSYGSLLKQVSNPTYTTQLNRVKGLPNGYDSNNINVSPISISNLKDFYIADRSLSSFTLTEISTFTSLFQSLVSDHNLAYY
jgi:hypothetical protein